jgi:signal peptidase I
MYDDQPTPDDAHVAPRHPNAADHTVQAPHDRGSAAYVQAWDAYVAQATLEGRRKQRARPLRVAREVVQTAVVALLIFLGTHSAVQGREVEGPSMQPNYHAGQRLFVNRLLYARVDAGRLSRFLPFLDGGSGSRYLIHQPRQGEVIVFRPPSQRGDDLIKRVIGVPGDLVQIKDGRVWVNGRLLDEPYLPQRQTVCGGQWCEAKLGPNQYYVMGDNRANSSDSRLWGPVYADLIVGKAWLIFSPFRDFGFAP